MDQNGTTTVTIEVIPPESNFKQEGELTRELEEVDEVNGANDTGSAGVTQFDATQDFDEVFGDKRAFDSWDEFTEYLELFQAKSGTRYKPRQSSKVECRNERRVGKPIPERFVYSGLNLICIHFGEAGSGTKRSYVGKGCGAFFRMSYSRGAMRIKQYHLTHSNHEPNFQMDDPHTRNFRVFNFTEELDHMLIKEVLKANPFEFKHSDKEWTEAVECLKLEDERFANITPRVLKKRTRLLLDNFAVICQGKKPPPEDIMGTMLYKLDQVKKSMNDGTPGIAKTQKRRARGRPRKVSVSEEEVVALDDEDDDDAAVSYSYTPKAKRSRKGQTPPKSPAKSVSNFNSNSGNDLSKMLSYLKKKDEEHQSLWKGVEEDRRLRQIEWEEDRKQRQIEAEEDRKLRQREIELRQEELVLQRERFEFEKKERELHMDLLKSQLQVFEQSMLTKQPRSQPPPSLTLPLTYQT